MRVKGRHLVFQLPEGPEQPSQIERQAGQHSQLGAQGFLLVGHEIDGLFQAHHAFHIGFVLPERRQQLQPAVPVVDVVVDAAFHQAQQLGEHGFVRRNLGGRQPQHAHGLPIHGGVGALRKAEREGGSHAAVAFLNIGIVVHHYLRNGLRDGPGLHEPQLIIHHHEFHILRPAQLLLQPATPGEKLH